MSKSRSAGEASKVFQVALLAKQAFSLLAHSFLQHPLTRPFFVGPSQYRVKPSSRAHFCANSTQCLFGQHVLHSIKPFCLSQVHVSKGLLTLHWRRRDAGHLSGQSPAPSVIARARQTKDLSTMDHGHAYTPEQNCALSGLRQNLYSYGRT